MIVGVSMVKDEADIIEASVRHLFAQGVDAVVVADNMSSDHTFGILDDLRQEFPITLLVDDEPAYYQADKMTRLAGLAGVLGADWIVPFDADELWCGIAMLGSCDAAVVRCVGFDHLPRAGGPLLSPWRRQEPQRLPKVAFRWCEGARLHMGNHGVDRPGAVVDGLTLRHFQYRSLDQMTRKLRGGKAAYDLTRGLDSHGQHWRAGGALSDLELAEKWAALCSEDAVFDPVPA